MTNIINSEPKQTVYGPDRVSLRLDASQIFLDEPGDGTPMLVKIGNETMTLYCAQENAKDIGATEEQHDWICAQFDDATDWMEIHYGLTKLAAQKGLTYADAHAMMF